MKRPTRPTILSLNSCYPREFFVGDNFYRQETLEVFLQRYMQGENPLYVCGIPQSGKTMFARDVARTICKTLPLRFGVLDKRRIHVIPYCGSIGDSISNLYIPGYILLPWEDNWGAKKEDLDRQRYLEKLQLLREYALDPSIYIIDGTSGKTIKEIESDPHFQDILTLGTIIIVSDDTESRPEWAIDPVPEEIMRANCVPDTVYTKEDRIVLQNACLLPPDGMITYTFIRYLGNDHWWDYDKCLVVKSLKENGFLPGEDNDRVFPCYELFIGNDEDYLPFLTKIYQWPDKMRQYHSRIWNKSCYILRRAAEILPDVTGQYAYWAADLHRRRGDYSIAGELYERFLNKQRLLTPSSPQMLAKALFESASYYVLCGDSTHDKISQKTHYQKASDYLDEVMSTHAKTGNVDLDLLSDALLLKAWLYMQEDDPTTADRLCRDVLEKQRYALSFVDSNLITWYIKVAALYGVSGTERITCGKYTEAAIRQLLDADSGELRDIADTFVRMESSGLEPENRKRMAQWELMSLKKLATKGIRNWQAMADACILMESCVDPSDADKRIQWERRALSILEETAAWNRHKIYSCHLQLAYLADLCGNLPLQIQELRWCIEILLERLPPNHPRIQMHLHGIKKAEKEIASKKDS